VVDALDERDDDNNIKIIPQLFGLKRETEICPDLTWHAPPLVRTPVGCHLSRFD